MSLRRRDLVRPFLAGLDESLAKRPPPPPKLVEFGPLDPAAPLGLEAEVDNLLVTRVLPDGQAWAAGVRAGYELMRVGGADVGTLDEAAEALEQARLSGATACTVTCKVEQEAKWRVF